MISTKSAYQKTFYKAKKYECDLSDKIAKAVDAGAFKKSAELTALYLCSFYCKLVALETAYKKMLRRNRPMVADPEGMAKSLDPFEGSQELVKLLMMPREDKPDHPRPVLAFALGQRALQYLVEGALRPHAKLAENQFLFNGGIHAAIQSVLQFLAEGYEAVVEVDINHCYNSFNEKEIFKLLPYLPEAVVKKVLIGRFLPLSVMLSGLTIDTVELQHEGNDNPFAEVLSEARRGIPQGSAVSPLVSDMLLSVAINELDIPETVRLVVYADNFLILAKSEEEAASLALALRSVLLDHPTGPLSSKLLHTGCAKDGFTFLGHAVKFSGTQFYVKPSNKNRQKFDCEYEKRLKKAMNDAQSTKKQLAAIARLERYVRSWSSTFRLCDGIDEWRLERLTYIRSLKKKIKVLSPSIPLPKPKHGQPKC